MSLTGRRRFVQGNLVWLLATALALVLLDALTLELFFVVALIGFLVTLELATPVSVTPRWRRRLRWIVAVGLLVFGYIVVRRILVILPPGVLP
ncbi:hypothetical protein [Halosimplex pelagicum]|uniref:Uncharacterized protein n=1 Tax=Halosimplex pelagicum TaxID=869886 RepID=A0A7D5P9S7_9EURY|nr:hypothetical protein [Halosimplex pelagicum]QLH81345.1 hypothetical protein HZS54_06775 [Halosimplex pelagicum]